MNKIVDCFLKNDVYSVFYKENNNTRFEYYYFWNLSKEQRKYFDRFIKLKRILK